MSRKQRKQLYLAGIVILAGAFLSSRPARGQCTDSPGQLGIQVSGATQGDAVDETDYYVMDFDSTSTITITGTGDTPCPTQFTCQYNSNTVSPDTDGGPIYTFAHSVGTQNPTNGPTIAWTPTTETAPGEYSFQLTQLEQKYLAAKNGYTGDAQSKVNTQQSRTAAVEKPHIETKTETPAPDGTTKDSRLKIGLGEIVDIKVTGPTDGVSFSKTKGNGHLTDNHDGTATLTASLDTDPEEIIHCTIRGVGVKPDTSFNVIAPTGYDIGTAQNIPNYGGTVGPPNNRIGGGAMFGVTLEPLDVSFHYVLVTEADLKNGPDYKFCQPDAAVWPNPLAPVPKFSMIGKVTPDKNNKWPNGDQCTTGALNPIGNLAPQSGGALQAFTIDYDLGEQYQDNGGSWHTFINSVPHYFSYSATGACSIGVVGNNASWGAFQGPWQ